MPRITKPYTAKSRPILFKGEMVKSILAGRKTQTRRVIKVEWSRCLDLEDPEDLQKAIDRCPFGVPGDFLWVRETWAIGGGGIRYRADQKEHGVPLRWKSSIYLRKRDSRISLRIVEIRVERIQSITGLDIAKEGIAPEWIGKAKDFDQEKYGYLDLSAVSDDKVLHHYSDLWNKFMDLWDSINAKRGYSWESDPWVWVIEFEGIEDE